MNNTAKKFVPAVQTTNCPVQRRLGPRSLWRDILNDRKLRCCYDN